MTDNPQWHLRAKPDHLPHAGSGACTCRWAVPTLFLSAPFWLDAEIAPWTCLRDIEPRALSTTDPCAICPRFEAHDRSTPVELPDADAPIRPSRSRTPLFADWFAAFPKPDEIL